jgi:hypothetical protein
MLRPCLALLLAVIGLPAQSAEGPAGRIRVKFRALSFDGAILGAGYLEGKEVRPLDLSADFFTAEQAYVGPNPVQFVLRDQTGPAVAPEVATARQQLTHAEARMLALSQELEAAQKRLGSLTAAARERGGKAKTDEHGEVGQLKAKVEQLTRTMNDLAREAAQHQEQVNHPAPAMKNGPEVKPDGKTTAKGRPAEARPAATAPEAVARPAHQPLATYAFPGDGRYLLLVHRTPAGTTINAIDDKDGAFPFGSMQFINLSGVDVEVRFGARTLKLAPNAKGVLRAGGAANTYAEGEIFTQGADGFHLGYSMRIFRQDDVRALYFLLPGEAGGHGVRLKGVEERQPPEPAAPTEAEGKPAPAKR